METQCSIHIFPGRVKENDTADRRRSLKRGREEAAVSRCYLLRLPLSVLQFPFVHHFLSLVTTVEPIVR